MALNLSHDGVSVTPESIQQFVLRGRQMPR